MVRIMVMLLERWLPPTCFHDLPAAAIAWEEAMGTLKYHENLNGNWNLQTNTGNYNVEKNGGSKMGFQDRSEMASRHLLPWHTAAGKLESEKKQWEFWQIQWEESGNENGKKWGWKTETQEMGMSLGNSDPATCFLDLQLQRSRVWEEAMGILGTGAWGSHRSLEPRLQPYLSHFGYKSHNLLWRLLH